MIPLRCTTGLTLRRHPHSPPPTNSKPAKGQVGATDSAYFNRKLVACAAALMLWLSTATGLLAQEPATELSDVQRIIRSTLQDRDPQEPVPVAQAAEMLVNVQLYEDAKAMLVRLQALQLNDEQLLELTAKVGSNFFQEIYLNRDLQPIGQTVGDYVLRGAHRGLQSPKRYDSLLRSLNSDDLSARNTALRQLRTIGEPAIANILNAFTQDARVEQFPGLRSALKSLATELPRPIIAAGTANDPQVKLEAIRAMAKINSKEALSVLYLAMLAPNQKKPWKHSSSNAILFYYDSRVTFGFGITNFKKSFRNRPTLPLIAVAVPRTLLKAFMRATRCQQATANCTCLRNWSLPNGLPGPTQRSTPPN